MLGTLLALAACGDNEGTGEPELAGASLTTDEDTPVSHTVEARDPTGRGLVLEAAPPAHGTVAVDGLRVTYTPDEDFHGADSFTVTVSGGAGEASAQIDVAVRSVNDAPAAVGDSFAAAEDTALVRTHAALLANDTDADGDALTLVSVQGATNGTVATAGTDVTFTPAPNFNGTASFQYTVSDGTAMSTTTVEIAVGGENDAPVAADDPATTQEDVALALAASVLVANDADPDGQTLTVTQVGNATNGTVVLDSGTATFTPAANFSGQATFEYTVSDGAAEDTGTVTIDVGPVNDAPVAVDDTGTTERDVPLVLATAALLANDTDIDGPALAVTAVQNEVNGAAVLVGASITFTPAAGFVGTASFDYVVGDGAATDVGTVSITVTAPPVCGDGAIGGSEACDDGGTAAGDGCSATCTIEPGWSCSGAPSTCTTVCGDGVVVGGEQCDDGNTTPGDGCSATCQREPLAVFTFTGAAGNETTLPADGAAPAPGLASIPVIRRGPGLSNPAGANSFSGGSFTTAAAVDPNDYFAFTITPATGFSVTLTEIELDERRSNTGIRNWVVRSSLDGFAADLAAFAVPDNDATRTDQAIPLGAAFADLTAPVEFRIYGFAAEAGGGTWRVDNIEVSGFTDGP